MIVVGGDSGSGLLDDVQVERMFSSNENAIGFYLF
jgi:hypothetical protein